MNDSVAVGSSRGGWGCRLTLSPGFMAWGFDLSLLVHFLAESVKGQIYERTSKGLDYTGHVMPPYSIVTRLKRGSTPDGQDGRGKVIRNAKGQWEVVRIRGPEDLVTLRSLVYNIPDRRRMRENLYVRPEALNTLRITSGGSLAGRIKRAVVTVHGGHINAAGVNVSNLLRAGSLAAEVELNTDQGKPAKVPLRHWIGETIADFSKLVAQVDRDGLAAFMVNRRRDIVHENLAKSQIANERTLRARERAARQAQRSDEQKHRIALQRAKRLGKQDGESAQAAWKRKSRERREKKGERREKKANPSLRTR